MTTLQTDTRSLLEDTTATDVDAATTIDSTTPSDADEADSSMMIVSTFEAMNASRRNTMEDVHIFHAPGTWGAPDPDVTYLGVYDGHGGRDMVEFLEQGMTHHVAQELSAADDSSIETRLERAFLMADIHGHQAGVQTSGATVAICLVKRSRENPDQVDLVTANAGDSRIVLGHQGQAVRLTTDHRVDDPLEVARIEQAGGFIFKGRVLGVLAVTRSLGDYLLKDFVVAHPDIQQRRLDLSREPTFLIVACDGLWDVLTDQEAVNLVLHWDGEKEDAAKYLVRESLRRGSTDNVTVVVAWLV